MAANSEQNTCADAHSLVDNMADTLAEMEEKMLGNTISHAEALVERLADTIREVAA